MLPLRARIWRWVSHHTPTAVASPKLIPRMASIVSVDIASSTTIEVSALQEKDARLYSVCSEVLPFE